MTILANALLILCCIYFASATIITGAAWGARYMKHWYDWPLIFFLWPVSMTCYINRRLP